MTLKPINTSDNRTKAAKCLKANYWKVSSSNLLRGLYFGLWDGLVSTGVIEISDEADSD